MSPTSTPPSPDTPDAPAPEPWRAVLSRTVLRQFQADPRDRRAGGLPYPVLEAALALINGPLLDNPWRLTGPLRPPLERYRSLHVGSDYRCLVQIDDDTRVVDLVTIERHHTAYRTPPPPGRRRRNR